MLRCSCAKWMLFGERSAPSVGRWTKTSYCRAVLVQNESYLASEARPQRGGRRKLRIAAHARKWYICVCVRVCKIYPLIIILVPEDFKCSINAINVHSYSVCRFSGAATKTTTTTTTTKKTKKKLGDTVVRIRNFCWRSVPWHVALANGCSFRYWSTVTISKRSRIWHSREQSTVPFSCTMLPSPRKKL